MNTKRTTWLSAAGVVVIGSLLIITFGGGEATAATLAYIGLMTIVIIGAFALGTRNQLTGWKRIENIITWTILLGIVAFLVGAYIIDLL